MKFAEVSSPSSSLVSTINAAGVKSSRVTAELGLPVDDESALIVDEHLRSPADHAIFTGGDCIALEQERLPKIGVHVIRQAPILFHNLLATLEGRPLKGFHPQKRFLWFISLGERQGLAMLGSPWWRGRSAFWLKDWLDRRFLSKSRT